MSLDAIKKSILSDAQAKASAIDSEASSESKRIVKEAEEKAKGILSRADLEAKAEADRLVKEARAGAETEANSMILEARGIAIERALKSVSSNVEKTISHEYSKKLFESGLSQFRDVSNSTPKVITSKKNANLLKGTKFGVEYSEIDGFIFSTDDGRIRLNASVGSVVEKSLDGARKLISKELFGEHATPKSRPARKQKSTSAKRGKRGKK